MQEDTEFRDREKLCALAPVTTAPLRHHVFVCAGTSCLGNDSAAVKEAFERELRERGMLFGKAAKGSNPSGSVVLTDCSSVGFCAVGAAVLVYPDGVWYAKVRESDVREIIETHLVAGRVVERLALLRLTPSSETSGVE